MKWIVIGLVAALLAAGVLRALSARKAQKEALQAQQSAQKTETVMALTLSDLVQVKTIELTQDLAISGPLKAVNSVVIKARVAGELQLSLIHI